MSLTVVQTNLPAPPYPADTKSNGFRFELDVDRLKRSDTWVLATPEMRPWLLMVWMVAWDQIPAGSLPADKAAIAAHLGMDARLFQANADILLRGFKPHSDGRLYHPFVASRVLEMISRRKGTAERMKRLRDASVRTCDASPSVTYAKDQDQDQDQEKERRLRLSVPAAPRSEVPYQQIVDAYHTALPTWKRVVILNDARKTAIRARWSDLPSVEHWAAYFRRVAKSPFLTNGTDAVFRNDNLDFLLRQANMAQIIEGKYDPRRNGNAR